MSGEGQLNPDETATLTALRREQDQRLWELVQRALDEQGRRLKVLEEKVEQLRLSIERYQVRACGSSEEVDRLERAVAKNTDCLIEMKATVSGLKVWVMVVGGISGVASFLAYLLK